MMSLPPGCTIADIGCGKGVMFQHLLGTNPKKLIAIDISAEMIRLAKDKWDDDRLELCNNDLFDASLPPLDAAVLFNAYPHFLDKQKLSERLAGDIRKGGALIIAHSMSRAEINGRHTGERVSTLSVALESAEAEANKFQKHFTAETLVDNDEVFFVKMTRR
jgi:demethylmenaquinone methyltransferase/2-methoxy-6-polyprenyl-1,4-benzoquinol methylase